MLRIHQPDPGPEKLGDILGRLFSVRGWGRRSARLKLEQTWLAIVDPKFGPHTKVLGFRRGILEVEVNDAILMQELSSFHRRKLVKALKETMPTLKDVKFRAGTW